jgi:hypothetical protein
MSLNESGWGATNLRKYSVREVLKALCFERKDVIFGDALFESFVNTVANTKSKETVVSPKNMVFDRI